MHFKAASGGRAHTRRMQPFRRQMVIPSLLFRLAFFFSADNAGAEVDVQALRSTVSSNCEPVSTLKKSAEPTF